MKNILKKILSKKKVKKQVSKVKKLKSKSKSPKINKTIKKVKSKKLNKKNTKKTVLVKKKVDGVEARVLQHEIDHLSGKLFVDYLSSLKRNIIIKKVKKLVKSGDI